MENGFERIIAKLKEYEQNHRKLILLERKELIVKNYENLTFELENEAEFSLWEEENSGAIRKPAYGAGCPGLKCLYTLSYLPGKKLSHHPIHCCLGCCLR